VVERHPARSYNWWWKDTLHVYTAGGGKTLCTSILLVLGSHLHVYTSGIVGHGLVRHYQAMVSNTYENLKKLLHTFAQKFIFLGQLASSLVYIELLAYYNMLTTKLIC
jgi:hypothetical protein